MRIWRWVYVSSLLLTLVVGLGVANPLPDMDGKDSRVPQYVVDPFWPKPLPNDPKTGKPWVTGEVAGSCVDSRDHIFTVNRGYNNGLVSPETLVAVASPPVVEYDPHGNVVNAWGDPAVLPNGVHGCLRRLSGQCLDCRQRRWHRPEVLAQGRTATADRHEGSLRLADKCMRRTGF